MKKLKIGSCIALGIGVVSLISSVLVTYLMLKAYTAQNGSIGIIGGADMPTAIFIFGRDAVYPFIFGITIIIASLFCLIFTKTVKNNCSVKTTALALGVSLSVAAGLTLFLIWYSIVLFGAMDEHPIRYPFTIICSLLCLVVFIILIVFYCKTRKKIFSLKGLIIDILTSILFFPFFMYLAVALINFIS